jgi:hypothetical protein
MMNKSGASLTSFTEAVIGVIIFLLVLVVIMIGMNNQYGQNYDPTFGLSTNDTQKAFEGYQGTLGTGMEGEASTNAINGVSVVTSWGMIKQGLRLIFDLVTGGFITNAIGLLHLGASGAWLALGLRLVFIFAIGFIMIKLLFKVSP